MTSYLLLYTDTPTRRILARTRPGRMILASDWVTDWDRAHFDVCVELPPPTEVPDILRILKSVTSDAVIAQSEWGILPGSLLGAGPSPEATHLCVNKYLSRQALEKADVPIPRYALVEDARQVRRFADRWPLMLKPVSSTSAHLVTRVDSPAELDERVARLTSALPGSFDIRRLTSFATAARLDLHCDPTRQFLVEEFAEGRTLETDGLVLGDRIVNFGVAEQDLSDRLTIDGYMFPADDAALDGATARALRAVGLRDSGYSIEFRGDTVIEINGRLGEDWGFPDMFHAALGEFPILKHMSRDASPCTVKTRVGLAYASRHEPGLVNSISVPEGWTPLIGPGERFNPDVADPHVAFALSTHPTSSRQAYREVRDVADRCRIEFK